MAVVPYTVLSNDAARQYIDARQTWLAWQQAISDAQQVRGGMYWHGQSDSLIRTSAGGAEKILGKRAVLQRIDAAGLALFLHVVGTHALYAYEAAAGVRFDADVTATHDIDLLWDVRKRMHFWSQMDKLGSSFLGVLRKVDDSFRLQRGQAFIAVNKKAFEIEVQAAPNQTFLDRPSFEAVIADRNGRMALMRTIEPQIFVEFKRWMATLPDREPLKRRRDLAQAQAVQGLLDDALLL
jgi:hypothetical protein